ncbi:FtsW/RodA/SpoVE family cell cycle protein [Candidatus Haliotispira prima]|uniref:FtsW/RodA/SpoVE family cell cycle protein n=1 Tax=Candidatus Haliotispira prima TaxID=3034016 RepID=A0ABY8MK99_9SPIO|nr:FtsW/RodA/SpoVE family cell cycle protein [Candidatus Haliotispira prima]
MVAMLRNLQEHPIDIILVVSTALLLLIGEVYIFSSSIAADGNIENYQFLRQLIWIIGGLGMMILFARIKLDFLLAYSSQLYYTVMLVLLLTGLLASSRNGTRAWMGFFGLGIQPSEFAKFSYIIFVSRYLGSRNEEERPGIVTLLVSLGITILPMGLVVFQGDIGTASVFAPIWFISLYVMGGNFFLLNHLFLFGGLLTALLFLQIWEPHAEIGSLIWNLAHVFTVPQTFMTYMIGLGLLLLPALGGLIYFKSSIYRVALSVIVLLFSASIITWFLNSWMRPYMKDRIVSFLNPDLDKLDSGWNLTQSLRAIGSGGMWGKGYLKGLIAHYGYLPEQSQSTDFLFAVIGEEGGLVIATLVFVCYFVLILRMILIARICEDLVLRSIVIAISAMFFFHFLQNVGMTIHLVPITGIPLLLVSYGGSSLVTAMALLGLVLNIHAQRKI